MKLHANAALSLNKRRLLCLRVVEQEWTLTQAAAAAEVSVRCARKWVRRYRAAGELGLLDRPQHRRRSPTAPASGASKRSPRCVGCASPARRSPKRWRCRCRRSRGSWPGSGWASSAASDLSPSSATSAPDLAS